MEWTDRSVAGVAVSASGRVHAAFRASRRAHVAISAAAFGLALLAVGCRTPAPSPPEAGPVESPGGEATAPAIVDVDDFEAVPDEPVAPTFGAGEPGADTGSEPGSDAPAPSSDPDRSVRLVAQIIAEYPHDAAAFTQGLLFHADHLYESTGLNSRSSLRRVDLSTGEVLQQVDLDERYFAEGLARVDDRLIQLTWQSGEAFVYDAASFEQLEAFAYEGEGWGLCYDGSRLVMSDGSSSLTFRDPETFERIGDVEVTLDGGVLRNLNELECVGDRVWANVWLTDMIVEIDPERGVVTSVVDAAPLKAIVAETAGIDVLNGIAHDPATGRFFVTGKLWPKLFEVEFVTAGGPGPSVSRSGEGGRRGEGEADVTGQATGGRRDDRATGGASGKDRGSRG